MSAGVQAYEPTATAWFVATATGPAPERPRLLVGTLVYVGLVVAVISTLGTPLIPLIADEQHVSVTTAQWILTATLLVGAVATPTLGRLGDGPKRRSVLVGGLTVVLTGSVVAATASAFPQLLAGRALMGVGIGLMPLAFAVARDTLPAPAARSAVAALSVTVATGAGLGFPLTGFVAEHFDYRVGFWIAAALTLVALGLVVTFLPVGRQHLGPHPHPDADPETDPETDPDTEAADAPRFDVAGAVLLGAALVAVLLAVSEGRHWGWTSPAVVGLAVGGAALAVGWVAVERRTAHPLVELSYLSSRPVMVADVVAVLMGFGMFGAMTLISRLVQEPTSTGHGFGESAAVTGLVLMPVAIGTLVASGAAGWVRDRFGSRAVLAIGGVVVACTSFGLAASRDNLIEMALATALIGVGIGTTFSAMPALIIANVPPNETGSATSLNSVLRTVGGSAGSALSVVVLASVVDGYTASFIMVGVAFLLAALASFALPRNFDDLPTDVMPWQRTGP